MLRQCADALQRQQHHQPEVPHAQLGHHDQRVVKYGTVNANTVFYYLGALRLASLTLSADFK